MERVEDGFGGINREGKESAYAGMLGWVGGGYKQVKWILTLKE
jgi:hypothetical protein